MHRDGPDADDFGSDAIVDEALTHFERGEHAVAVATLQAELARQAEPDQELVHVLALMLLVDTPDAEARARTLEELLPAFQDAERLASLVDALQTGRDSACAWRACERLCALVSSTDAGAGVQALRVAADAAMDARDWADAEPLLRRLVRVPAQRADACFNLAWLSNEQDLGWRALRLYRCALALRPDDRDTLYNIAWTLEQLGRTDEAREGYEFFLDDPESAEWARDALHRLAGQGRDSP